MHTFIHLSSFTFR